MQQQREEREERKSFFNDRRSSFRIARNSNPELDNSEPLIVDNESGTGNAMRPSFKDDSFLI
jgi:hypothetical protein